MRSFIFMDILRRVLKYNGYKLKHVMNITDVGHWCQMRTKARQNGQDGQETQKSPWR